MSAFTPLPLGRRIPDRLHAVSVSLPTMADVRGYERRDPAVLRHMTSGYPRFVVHPLLQRLGAELARREGWSGRRVWPVSSARMALELAVHFPRGGALVFSVHGVDCVTHADTPELAAQAKTYLQHTGGLLSARAAEDRLAALGVLEGVEPEPLWEGDARAEIARCLSAAMPAAGAADLFLTSSGINAVYASFRALADLQAARGRTLWVQLGWLYLDTIAILKKFAAEPEHYAVVRHVADRGELERIFATEGGRLAGIVAEVPTNPLIQTPDVPWLAAEARRHGAGLILDASVASPWAVDLLPHGDVVVASLTKYAASEGDVLAGVAAVNPAGPDAAELRRRLAERVQPLYGRDAARLAAQIGQTESVLGRIEENVARVAAFLEAKPQVRRVHWARQALTGAAFATVARRPESAGCMLSFELHGPMERFFDATPLPKGPSFGLTTSLLCPFIWLAHFDLVTSEAGRAELAASGIDPDLMRLAVGAEPIEDILDALDAGFRALG